MSPPISDEEKGAIRQRAKDCRHSSLSALARYFKRSRCAIAAVLGLTPDGKKKVVSRNAKKRATTKRLRDAKILELAQQVKEVNGRRFPAFGSTRKIEYEMKAQQQPTSHQTISRVLKARGFKPRVRPIVPINRPDVLKKRLAFAEFWLTRPVTDFERLVFSDEHWITSNDNSCRIQWVKDPQDLLLREQLNPLNVPSVMIWAAVGLGWRSPLVIVFHRKPKNHDDGPRGITADNYVRKCLAKIATSLTSRKLIFQQDGARIHTAKQTLAYLDRKKIPVMQNWPPYSPDLNPIEQLWPILDCAIAEQVPTSVKHLEAVAKACWDAIPQSKIDNFVLSFAAKVKMCEKAKGSCMKIGQN